MTQPKWAAAALRYRNPVSLGMIAGQRGTPIAGHIRMQFDKLSEIGEVQGAKVSENNPIRVFVTHTFAETDDYLRVFEFLEAKDNFFYLNVTKPENVPTSGGLDAIKEELIAQIKESEAVVVLATLYEEKPDLVKFQLDVAEANELPIIAIRSFGGMAETPADLVERANEHIEWNDREMVNALKRQARLEDTSRWDVIDFP